MFFFAIFGRNKAIGNHVFPLKFPLWFLNILGPSLGFLAFHWVIGNTISDSNDKSQGQRDAMGTCPCHPMLPCFTLLDVLEQSCRAWFPWVIPKVSSLKKNSRPLKSLRYVYLIPGDILPFGCIPVTSFHYFTVMFSCPCKIVISPKQAAPLHLNHLNWNVCLLPHQLTLAPGQLIAFCSQTCRFVPGFTLMLEKGMNAASVSFRIPCALTLPMDADNLDVLDDFAPGKLGME